MHDPGHPAPPYARPTARVVGSATRVAGQEAVTKSLCVMACGLLCRWSRLLREADSPSGRQSPPVAGWGQGKKELGSICPSRPRPLSPFTVTHPVSHTVYATNRVDVCSLLLQK